MQHYYTGQTHTDTVSFLHNVFIFFFLLITDSWVKNKNKKSKTFFQTHSPFFQEEKKKKKVSTQTPPLTFPALK